MVDWGDVPTWLAFVGAAAAAWYTRRTLEIERGRDRRADDDRRRAQAELVSAWIDDVRVVSDGTATTEPGVVVRNLGSQPIHAVSVRVHPAGHPSFVGFERPVVPPSSTLDGYLFDPVEHPERGAFVMTDGREPDDPDAVIRAWGLTLTFRDGAGRTWQRPPDGRLVERGVDHAGAPDGPGRPTAAPAGMDVAAPRRTVDNTDGT